MIYRYLCEIDSREAENMSKEELRKAQRQAKKEEENKKKELEEQRRKDEIDKENKDQYSKSVDYLDTDYNNADKKESVNESLFDKFKKNKKKQDIKEQTLIEAANIEIAGKSDPKLISKVKKQFKEDRPDMLKDAQYKYPTSNLKLSDIRICFIDFREIDNGRKYLNYQVSIGEEDGFYDCWIDITKNEDDFDYSDYTFND